MKPLLVTSGEPAGIGPDICLSLAGNSVPLVVLADRTLLQHRATQLGLDITFVDYDPETLCTRPRHLTVFHQPCVETPTAGELNPNNSGYVINMLTTAAEQCLAGYFSGLVTAPVHKAVINQAGISFTGHTEFFAEKCQVATVVMLLACDIMKVALMTTHLPLRNVSDVITQSLIIDTVHCLNVAFKRDFNIKKPRFLMAGINPHAGEGGYLGDEEIKTLAPAIQRLIKKGIDVQGPLSADTLFTPDNINACDAFIAMYHDQGLAVLKYAGFGQAVNITLGLPIIRTSVDHGTALGLAGTGNADTGSLLAAVKMAAKMAENRLKKNQ